MRRSCGSSMMWVAAEVNPLGIPETLEGWQRLRRVIHERPHRSASDLLAQARYELRVVDQWRHGRWPHTPFGREPDPPYVPGDVLELRSLAAALDVGEPPYPGGALSAVVLDGVPLWLDAGVDQGVICSHPPTPEQRQRIRLPWPETVVWLASAPRVGIRDLLPPEIRQLVWQRLRPGMRAHLAEIPYELTNVRVLAEATTVRLVGIGLPSTRHSKPESWVAWVLRVRGIDQSERSRPLTLIVPGWRGLSTWWELLDCATAIAAWGDWRAEGTKRSDRGGHRADLRALAKSPDLMALGPVRTLDMRRTQTHETRTGTGTVRGSPRTHLRRGHWRRQRVGHGEQWHYEDRWIPPTVVAPTGPESGQLIVWTLPRPKPIPTPAARPPRTGAD